MSDNTLQPQAIATIHDTRLTEKWGEDDDTVYIIPGAYRFGQGVSLSGYTEIGEPVSVYTVNLVDYGFFCEDKNHVYIADYSEHEGNVKRLVDGGIVEPIRDVFFGPFYAKATYCKLLVPVDTK